MTLHHRRITHTGPVTAKASSSSLVGHRLGISLAQPGWRKSSQEACYPWGRERASLHPYRTPSITLSCLTGRMIQSIHTAGVLGQSRHPKITEKSHCKDRTLINRLFLSPSRVYISAIVCMGTFTASFASAIFAPGSDSMAKDFGVSSEVGVLGTTLFVLGFASGPLIWAPYSELAGRRWPLMLGILGVALFSIASAVAKDIQTVIICRFFAGLFGASQLSVVPAVLSDLYNNLHRGPAITVYSLAVFVGPFSGPFVGGFISASYLGWRWTLYIPAFMAFACGALFVASLRETYAPCLLVPKAQAIRRATLNWGVHAPQERVEVDFQQLMEKYFTRPMRMLITEPTILVVSLYMSFIYGLVYALLEAYPYVFASVHGMSLGVRGLPFIALIIGQVLACIFVLSRQPAYMQQLSANRNLPVPEWRLPPAIMGAPIFTVGIFW